MLAPAFRYAHQDLPIAAGELARDQPDPGSKMPSVFELGSVADGRNDRGGRLRADALDGGDAPACKTEGILLPGSGWSRASSPAAIGRS